MPYKIDNIDRRILFELDKNCRISDNQIAKLVGRSRESVGYRIKQLQKKGILQGFLTSINPSKYGYMFFKLYFQLANIPKERERFFEYMKKLPGLYWIGINDGVWDTHATLYAKNVKEFYKIKNQIYSEFKDLIIKRDTGVLVNVRQYKKKYLIEDGSKIPDYDSCVMFSDDIVPNEIDELDRKILNILLNNARIPLVDLAKQTKSTVDVVRNRMKKLQEKGIILQYRIAVDHSKLGYEFFKAFLYFNNLSEEDEQRLFEYAKGHPSIIYLIRQVSSWDVELEMVCKSYEDFTSIMNDIRKRFATSLRNYESVFMKEDIWVFGEKDIFEK
ncbi:MAG: Lrp/AsnC family transcriptional regulator [Candidatus Micrarchaeota archaeon]